MDCWQAIPHESREIDSPSTPASQQTPTSAQRLRQPTALRAGHPSSDCPLPQGVSPRRAVSKWKAPAIGRGLPLFGLYPSPSPLGLGLSLHTLNGWMARFRVGSATFPASFCGWRNARCGVVPQRARGGKDQGCPPSPPQVRAGACGKTCGAPSSIPRFFPRGFAKILMFAGFGWGGWGGWKDWLRRWRCALVGSLWDKGGFEFAVQVMFAYLRTFHLTCPFTNVTDGKSPLVLLGILVEPQAGTSAHRASASPPNASAARWCAVLPSCSPSRPRPRR